jgi:serine/threonine-protein kinase
MGTVFFASDIETNQEVALKTLAPEVVGTPGVLDALRKEVATARRLPAHANLLRTFETHLSHDPPFLVMEAVTGGDLHEQWLANSRKLPVDEVIRLTSEILGGLGVLHKARIVHQDIKPQNILMAEDGSVRIADYGISSSIKEQIKSQGGDGSGTPAYMAPEQFRGDICDGRTER